jgi:hypothetical protein
VAEFDGDKRAFASVLIEMLGNVDRLAADMFDLRIGFADRLASERILSGVFDEIIQLLNALAPHGIHFGNAVVGGRVFGFWPDNHCIASDDEASVHPLATLDGDVFGPSDGRSAVLL